MESGKVLALFGMATACFGGLAIWSLVRGQHNTKERERLNKIQEILLHQEVSSRSDQAPLRKLSMEKMPASQGVSHHLRAVFNGKEPDIPHLLYGRALCRQDNRWSMTRIQQSLEEKGFKVFIVPEAATMLQKGGAFISTPQMGMVEAVKFQIQVLRLQMSLEDIFTEIAVGCAQPVVILCDRGVMDGCAYCGKEIWQALLDETGWNSVQLRDRRYEAVFHLVTAAIGAETYYENNTNSARYETLEEARSIDGKLMEAWVGHPHFIIVDNTSVQGFNEKIEKCENLVLKFIGLPNATTFQKKLLVTYEFIPENSRSESFTVEETFLKPGQGVQFMKIRRRGQYDAYTYQTHYRILGKDGQRIDKKKQVTAREYMQFMSLKMENRRTIIKRRCCFLWQTQSFILDTMLNVEGSPSILRIETDGETKHVSIPPFIKVVQDCTDDKQWTTWEMSKLDWTFPEVTK